MPFYVRPFGTGQDHLVGKEFLWRGATPDLPTLGDLSDVYKKGDRLLNPEEVPRKLVLSKNPKARGAFVSTDGIMIVPQPIKDLIEELDPGVHQFFPIEVTRHNGTALDHPCFIMNVHLHQSSIIDAESEVDCWYGCEESHERMDLPVTQKVVTLDPAGLSGVNLWRENRYRHSLMLSDALDRELRARKLKFFGRFKARHARG
ncbi:MAG: DUF1629 domain-containing protein [Pseudomonadota bacterium]